MKKPLVSTLAPLSALLISAVVVALMLYRASAHADPGEGLELSLLGWAVLVGALACLVASVGLLLYSRYLASFGTAPAIAPSTVQPTANVVPGPNEGEVDEPVAEGIPDPAIETHRLSEDERKVMEMIAAAGGGIFQKNLVASGEFSKSKVTRLLDKLEGRGLIRRERHGMTNMVRLQKEP